MNRFIILLFVLFMLFGGAAELPAQHTFSIVAVDPATGEVGSAGATCLDDDDCGGCGGAIVISGLIPGRGAVHAQALICLPNNNLRNGLDALRAGFSPATILQQLLLNDACASGDARNRQYGIVDFDPDGRPRVEAYTGSSCLPYAGHLTGANYAIQGNILRDGAVLEGMRRRFDQTAGSLAQRLMAALQGARAAGGDSRCLAEGRSARSAFLRVACPGDAENNLCLDINISRPRPGHDPIDDLQLAFDRFTTVRPATGAGPRVYPTLTRGPVFIEGAGGAPRVEAYDCRGQRLPLSPDSRGAVDLSGRPPGVYLLRITDGRRPAHAVRIVVH